MSWCSSSFTVAAAEVVGAAVVEVAAALGLVVVAAAVVGVAAPVVILVQPTLLKLYLHKLNGRQSQRSTQVLFSLFWSSISLVPRDLT